MDKATKAPPTIYNFVTDSIPRRRVKETLNLKWNDSI
jgi:hypothetical protein